MTIDIEEAYRVAMTHIKELEKSKQLLKFKCQSLGETINRIRLLVGRDGTACQCQGESCVYCDIRKLLPKEPSALRGYVPQPAFDEFGKPIS